MGLWSLPKRLIMDPRPKRARQWSKSLRLVNTTGTVNCRLSTSTGARKKSSYRVREILTSVRLHQYKSLEIKKLTKEGMHSMETFFLKRSLLLLNLNKTYLFLSKSLQMKKTLRMRIRKLTLERNLEWAIRPLQDLIQGICCMHSVAAYALPLEVSWESIKVLTSLLQTLW